MKPALRTNQQTAPVKPEAPAGSGGREHERRHRRPFPQNPAVYNSCYIFDLRNGNRGTTCFCC